MTELKRAVGLPLLAGFSAFTYGELAARFPRSAGEAVYIHEGFGSAWLARATGLLIAAAGMVSAATIARGFHGYFSGFLQLPEPVVVATVILSLGALAAWDISQSVATAALCTLIEIGGLLLVVWVGREHLAALPQHWGELVPPVETSAATGILLGAFLAFFAFIGFEDMVNIAEEVRDPGRTLPAGILLALATATVIYVLVSLVAMFALDTETLATSDAPLADVLAATSGLDPRIMSLIGMIAVVNGALIQMIMAARIFYGMAARGWLWRRMAVVSRRTRTPLNATALVVAIILALALWFPLETLARSTSFLVLGLFALANAALVLIKRSRGPVTGILDNPLWVPVTGCAASTGLLLFQVLHG